MKKPFSQACENNKGFILEAVKSYFMTGNTVLEIASGTTQHVQFLANQLPDVVWQPSDIPSNMAIVEAGLEGISLKNILPPVVLDVQQAQWPAGPVQGVFSANSLHIMPFEAVKDFFRGVGEILQTGGYLCVYGPFKYDGQFTTESNANFDIWLKSRDSQSGIRDFEAVNALAKEAGLQFIEDHQMPANNQLLVWQKMT